MAHYVHKINCKKSDMSRMLPMDAHTVVTTYDIYPDGSIKADAHIVQVDKCSGRIKKHMTICTERGHL